MTGKLEAFPGNVLAVISTMFVKPSPSESSCSIAGKLCALLGVSNAIPYEFLGLEGDPLAV